jgi:hypothetical protein
MTPYPSDVKIYEVILKKYIEDNKLKGEYKYLITFKNYILSVKENKG